MKKLAVFLLLLAISAAGFCQVTATKTTSLVKNDYLSKSKHQKTAGLIMLIGGASCVLIMPILWYTTIKNENGSNVFSALSVAGLISIPASIPLFIASHRNKKKGMSLSFKNETAPQLQKNSLVYRTIPSLTLKISL